MNEDSILAELDELNDQLIVCTLLAKRKLQNGNVSGAYQMLTDAIKAIEDLREQFP
jgi:RNA processing factor Prp31